MAFEQWKIDKMRYALSRYRTGKARNGRPPSWEVVLIDLLTSPVTEHVFPEDGSQPEFKAEALRRFANGTSVLDPLKLKDVWQFLVHHGYLKSDDVDENSKDLKDFLAVRDYLSVAPEQIAFQLHALQDHYVAERKSSPEYERTEFHVFRDPSDLFFRVEERHIAIDTTKNEKDNGLIVNETRRGYGIVSTRSKLLHIFLRGNDTSDLVNYFQMKPEQYLHNRLSFLCCGGSLDESKMKDRYHSGNVLEFAPTELSSTIDEYSQQKSAEAKR